MLHYLFTNDLRREQWPQKVVDAANRIHSNNVPNQHEDKSGNNNIRTLESYLCIQKGSVANAACRNGAVDSVILNFINRFQFPNARTNISFRSTIKDRMCIAPLRNTVQLLYALSLIDSAQAYLTYDELVYYLICDVKVATTQKKNFNALATKVIEGRAKGVAIPHKPTTKKLRAMGVEWKQCPRQIKELFSLLYFVPFVYSTSEGFVLKVPSKMDTNAAKRFFIILNNSTMWDYPKTRAWASIQKSYQDYMNDGVLEFIK